MKRNKYFTKLSVMNNICQKDNENKKRYWKNDVIHNMSKNEEIAIGVEKSPKIWFFEILIFLKERLCKQDCVAILLN